MRVVVCDLCEGRDAETAVVLRSHYKPLHWFRVLFGIEDSVTGEHPEKRIDLCSRCYHRMTLWVSEHENGKRLEFR